MTRLMRSLLVLPAHNRRFLEKAAGSGADAVLLDLEDSVPAADKDSARRTLVEALNELDWGRKTVMVRANGLESPWTYQDVIAVLGGAGGRFDLFMLPKVERPGDIVTVATLIDQVERSLGLAKPAGLDALIETAGGLRHAEAIAEAHPRLEGLHFGPADYAASMGIRTTAMGGANPDYQMLTHPDAAGRRDSHWGDASHYPLARMAVAARAAGLRPIDGAYADFPDIEGFRAQARRARALGCEGKWCIHPSQVAAANELFSPSPEEVALARRILSAMADAAHAGRAALVLDGRMIDIATVRQAQALVAKAETIGTAYPDRL
ncbi:MAG: CoA ester lyase [Magnetospirillum sp. WYHS-4]